MFRSSTSCSRGYFNSRPHGGRHATEFSEDSLLAISTHALTEGDNTEESSCEDSRISTHALTEGDKIPPEVDDNYMAFQLTPSRRATTAQSSLAQHCIFQLTPSRRATFFCAGFDSCLNKFQLTPSRRATLRKYFKGIPMIFQLTPSRRATCAMCCPPYADNFNSRPHGGRQSNLIILIFSTLFQLTPSRRATGNTRGSETSRAFQLTPSRRATCA